MLDRCLLFLGLALVVCSSHGLRAADANLQIGPDQLDFYLFQAFAAESQAQRYRLNHIGIQGEPTTEGFLVSGALQDYPAHNAGIVRGDVITASDGRPFHPVFSFNDSAIAPTGLAPLSRSYDLELRRGEQTMTVSVSPVFENLYDSYRIATLNSVQEFSSGNKTIGYVQLWSLARSTDSLFSLQQLITGLANCDGIIVDLRGSYGFLDQEHFKLFSLNTPELTLSGAPPWLESWSSPAYPVEIEAYRKPAAILIDESTRAAAELMVMALDDAERIISLGAATAGLFGQFELEGDTLNYEAASNFMVNGSQPEDMGVEPEQAVEFPFTESRRDDPQFEAAVTLLLGVI